MMTENEADTATSNGQPTRLDRLTEQLLDHLETRWEYVTLTVTEKTSQIVASLVSLMAVGVFGLLTLLFLCLGLAYWLGDVIGSRAGGFVLAAVIFIPLGAVSYYLVKPFIRTKIIQNILQDDDDTPHQS